MVMKQEKSRKIEILAPAGSMEGLRAAVAAGADAVYMGGSRFGARTFKILVLLVLDRQCGHVVQSLKE